ALERLDQRAEDTTIGDRRQYRGSQLLNGQIPILEAGADRQDRGLSDRRQGSDRGIAHSSVGITQQSHKGDNGSRVTERGQHRSCLFTNSPIFVFQRRNLFKNAVRHRSPVPCRFSVTPPFGNQPAVGRQG